MGPHSNGLLTTKINSSNNNNDNNSSNREKYSSVYGIYCLFIIYVLLLLSHAPLVICQIKSMFSVTPSHQKKTKLDHNKFPSSSFEHCNRLLLSAYLSDGGLRKFDSVVVYLLKATL